jgi:hypothetical protein
MNPDTISAAFRKTRIWPLDPSVITEAMMAPSTEMSCEGYLPIEPTSPVKAVAMLLRVLSVSNPDNEDGEDVVGEPLNNPDEEPLPADTVSMQVAVSTALQ